MRTSLRSTEASLKYVIFGAVSSGIMLYGLSLLYGLTGAATFDGIRAALMAGDVQPFALLVIIVLVIAGLGFRAQWAGAMMVVFLFSLTGLPPTAGFIGKFYLFAEVMNQQWYWLAIVGVLNSVISLFYYMKIAKALWFTKAQEGHDGQIAVAPLHYVVMAVLAVPTLVFGLYWGLIKALADRAIEGFVVMEGGEMQTGPECAFGIHAFYYFPWRVSCVCAWFAAPTTAAVTLC